MATGDYCTLGELKARIWPTGTTPDTDEDNMLQNVISSVSRWIDNYTGTRFYTTSADETRYFTADDEDVFYPPDMVSLTTLATDNAGTRTYGDTWAATDYDLIPYNYALEGVPIRQIERAPLGTYSFPLTRKSVKLIGKFGYCTAANQPKPVEEACLIQCERIFKRKDAPFGIISNPEGEMRLLTDLDPDVRQMLEMYRRMV